MWISWWILVVFLSNTITLSYSFLQVPKLNVSIPNAPPPLMVPLTLIQGAAANGALCLDRSLPAYHLHPGYGSGANSWLIQLEGGGWCTTKEGCVARKTTERGSSTFMQKQLPFTGMLSNKSQENPAAMQELMSQGMRQANQALLSGMSAGAVASILHCDEFRELFPSSTKIKCLIDAGLCIDVLDISGGRTLRDMFQSGVEKNLLKSCANHSDPTWCFFPQNLIANIQTPLFLLNAGYDTWMVGVALAPNSADHNDYRGQLLNDIKAFSELEKNGLFINSCFVHDQSEKKETWFADGSPMIHGKGIAQSVGDWYFDRMRVNDIDCPYPCDTTCHHQVF